MSKLLFLPDRNGREKESDGAGLVRLSADTSEMAALAKRMVIRQETDEITPDAAYQGAMALALLLDSWQGTDVRLAVRTIDAQKSRFASWVMAARPMEQRNQPIRLLMLVKDQQEALLGLVDAENGLTLAAQMGDIWDMMPERATWVNREDQCFYPLLAGPAISAPQPDPAFFPVPPTGGWDSVSAWGCHFSPAPLFRTRNRKSSLTFSATFL